MLVSGTAQAREYDVYRNTSDTAIKATCYKRLGSSYQDKDDYENAAKAYEQAAQHYHRVDNSAEEATCLNNLGYVNQGLGRFTEAVSAYQRALTICEILNDVPGQAVCLSNLADACQAQRKYKQAMEFYSKAAKKYVETGDDRGVASSYRCKGSIWNSFGMLEPAAKVYNSAVKWSRHAKDLRGEAAGLLGARDCSSDWRQRGLGGEGHKRRTSQVPGS